MGTVSGDWDCPFSDDDLQAIDSIFQSAVPSSAAPPCSSSSPSPHFLKRHSSDPPTGDDEPAAASSSYSDSLRKSRRRRLPESLFAFQQRNSSRSFSLSPCRLNNSYFSSSYQGDLKMRYQAMAFKGRIVYSKTLEEVESSAKELLKFVDVKRCKEGLAVLGFDIEWRPTFRRGASPGKAAVMQICCDRNLCHVMHIFHSGVTPSLQSLLENPISLKVGVNISYDARKIFKDHNVSVNSLQDLSNLANEKFGESKKWSLSALNEKLVAKELPKPNIVRMGNWEADVLSQQQLRYAATDAFASWNLFQVLNNLPDAVSKNAETEEPSVVTPEVSV